MTWVLPRAVKWHFVPLFISVHCVATSSEHKCNSQVLVGHKVTVEQLP